MKYDEVPSGQYMANAVRARSGKSANKGTPFIEVEFNIPEVEASLRWTGYLTEKTTERVMDTMALLDWDGDTDFKDGAINTERQVALTVERETAPNGKEYPRIAWVNERLGGGNFEGLAPEETKQVFAGLNLKAAMAAARQRKGGGSAPKAKAPVKNHAPGAEDDSDSELPF